MSSRWLLKVQCFKRHRLRWQIKKSEWIARISKHVSYRWQRSSRHLVHLHGGPRGWRMGGMGRGLALLQLRWGDVRIGPAAHRGMTIRIVSLLGCSLRWAPKTGRRETTRLRRQVSIHSHLWRWGTILSLRNGQWTRIQPILGSSCKRESSGGLGECGVPSWRCHGR